ncbi:DNA repair protein [Pseudomonas sp. RIT623]|uniref:DNA repair protein n=1 Tax=Pseudomonas sp. RIT623 TaxID=2559075 RepID=UPI00106F8543|nr:DNA repair protein [Pseudomonas sp. RIT623]TFF42523.1 DNA repair protein [Pseudomonas sp. RIT623]
MNKGAYRRRCTWLVLALGASLAAPVSADTLEERLRAQLRSTTQQLQALQSEQAQASAARQAAEQQRDAALGQVRELTAQLAKARGQSEQLAGQQQAVHSQAQALVASSSAQLHKYKQAYDELLGMARAKESERVGLQAQLAERDGQVQQCQARNQQMYGVAKDMLAAYEKVDIADVVKMRQPFAGAARVRFEELAQAYGDKLYESQFDAPTGVTQ